MHAMIFDLLDQPRSSWAAIILHGGKGGRAERLVEVIESLPEGIRCRLALENDERAYGAADIFEICRRAGIPMIFDAHHHVVREGLDSFEDGSIADYVEAARETWPDPSWQIVHISNGRDGHADARHSELIHTMPSSFRTVPFIEVEAKHKELAIQKLNEEWLQMNE
jgi:UV DNA damage endonuclease